MKKLAVFSLVVVCFFVFTSGSVFARHNIVPFGGHYATPPPPPPTFNQPVAVFVKLDAETIFNALAKEGLAENPILVKGTNRNKFKFYRQIQFTYMAYKGYICEFNSEKAFYKAQEETLDMNDKGEPNTWSIIQDNIILVLDGKLSEEDFLKFQEVLRNLNK